jgi:hypothetical protein
LKDLEDQSIVESELGLSYASVTASEEESLDLFAAHPDNKDYLKYVKRQKIPV